MAETIESIVGDIEEIPKVLITKGDDLYKRGAKFYSKKDAEGRDCFYAELSGGGYGAVYRRVSDKGPQEEHIYLLVTATREALFHLGFEEIPCEENLSCFSQCIYLRGETKISFDNMGDTHFYFSGVNKSSTKKKPPATQSVSASS